MNIRLGLLILLFGVCNCVFAQKAIDFAITDSKGNSHQLSTLLDQGKYVVLEIFHTFSPESNTIAYEVQKLYEEWGKGEFLVEFMALSNRDFDNNSTINKFQKKYRVSFPHAGPEGDTKSVVQTYTKGPWGNWPLIPTFILITPDSTVIPVIRGNNSQATIDSIDQALLSAGAIKPFVVKGSVTVNEKPLERVQVRTSLPSSVVNDKTTVTDEEGEFILVFDQIPEDRQLQVLPSKNDDHDNGVSTFDLVFMIKHILGSEVFDDPLKYIAADVNRSGTITATDVVETKKLILLIDTAFKNNTSWRFIPKEYEFKDPTAPLSEIFPEYIPLDNIISNIDRPNFVGIKIGDVTFSAKPTIANNQELEQRTNFFSLSYFSEIALNGTKVHFYLNHEESILGFQMSIGMKGTTMEIDRISSSQLPGWNENDYFKDKDKIKISYASGQSSRISSDVPLFTIELKNPLSKPVSWYLDHEIPPEFYDSRHNIWPISITESASGSNTRLSPNPSVTNNLTVRSDKSDISSIQLFSLNGAHIKTYYFGQVSYASFELPATMKAGTYHLKIEKSNGTVETKRLVKI